MATTIKTKVITPLYSSDDICEIFQISRQTRWRWSREGKLPPPVLIGKSPKWTKEDIDFLLIAYRGGSQE